MWSARKGLLYCGLAASWVVACGIVPVGSTVVPNDPIPAGTVVFSGTLTGVGGQSVSGTASVYSEGNGTYVLRLNGLVAPNVTGLNVVLDGGGQQGIVNTALRATSGSQNYNFTATVCAFDTVEIYYTTASTDYGTAPLVPTGSSSCT